MAVEVVHIFCIDSLMIFAGYGDLTIASPFIQPRLKNTRPTFLPADPQRRQ